MNYTINHDQLHPLGLTARFVLCCIRIAIQLKLIFYPGKVRLAKWFQTMPQKAKAKIVKDVTQLVLARRTRMCNFLEYKGALYYVSYVPCIQWPTIPPRYQGGLPSLRILVLCVWDRFRGQRTHHARNHPPLRRGVGPILWKCELWVQIDNALPINIIPLGLRVRLVSLCFIYDRETHVSLFGLGSSTSRRHMPYVHTVNLFILHS